MKNITVWLRNNAVLFTAILIVLSVSIFYSTQKDGYFIDEVYTFGLANNPYGPFLEAGESSAPLWQYMYDNVYGKNLAETADNLKVIIKDIKEKGVRGSEIFKAYKDDIYAQYSPKWFDKTDFLRYVAVQQGHRFDIPSIYYNQFRDVHPPLYYLLVNLGSSLLINTIPNNVGISINLICLLLICFILYQFSEKYFENKIQPIAVVLFFGLSLGTISMVMFIRMYALLTLFVVLNLWLHLLILESGFQYKKNLGILLMMSTAAGFLTQYFFLIYLFFIMITTVFIMVSEKKYKEILKYCSIMISAGVISIVFWPISIRHIFFSSKGTEAAENLVDNQIWVNMKDFIDIISKGFCLNLFIFSVIFAASILAVIYFFLKERSKYASLKKWYLVFIPMIGYLLVVCKICTIQSDRYIMGTYPMISFAIVCIVYKTAKIVFKKKGNLIAAITLLGIILLAFAFHEPNYLYKKTTADIEFDEISRGKRCLYIYSVWNTYTVFVPEFIQNNNQVMFINEDNLEIIEELEISDTEELLIYISNTVHETQVKRYLAQQFGEENIKLIKTQVSAGIDPDETFMTDIYKIY